MRRGDFYHPPCLDDQQLAPSAAEFALHGMDSVQVVTYGPSTDFFTVQTGFDGVEEALERMEEAIRIAKECGDQGSRAFQHLAGFVLDTADVKGPKYNRFVNLVYADAALAKETDQNRLRDSKEDATHAQLARDDTADTEINPWTMIPHELRHLDFPTPDLYED